LRGGVNAYAVNRAKQNAVLNQATNGEFVVGEAEAIFASTKFPAQNVAAIIDPPRAGCTEIFLQQLIAYGPTRLVYVSCDPATQARDVKILVAGGYRFLHAQPFDLFPQTRHIESVVTMEKVSGLA
jgi:23S rRNA (uracil1939-C5)-methyltransferase/tRNA (uracil-5-)-methyltransferase